LLALQDVYMISLMYLAIYECCNVLITNNLAIYASCSIHFANDIIRVDVINFMVGTTSKYKSSLILKYSVLQMCQHIKPMCKTLVTLVTTKTKKQKLIFNESNFIYFLLSLFNLIIRDVKKNNNFNGSFVVLFE
jgi:hypothetical protein